MRAYLNPLKFIEADDIYASATGEELTSEAIIRYLCTPGTEHDLKSIVGRYKEISNEDRGLFVVPADERIMGKIIWPMRQAKVSYMIGNYIGTISLCGIVVEMVAVLLFDISEIRIGPDKIDKTKQKSIFGSKFENLGQERRVDVLRAFGVIDDDMKNKFDLVRTTRRKYLHLWSKDHNDIAQDSIAIYKATLYLTSNIIGQDIRDGMFVVKSDIQKYLENTGAIRDPVDAV